MIKIKKEQLMMVTMVIDDFLHECFLEWPYDLLHEATFEAVMI